jgi:hypothetical protein
MEYFIIGIVLGFFAGMIAAAVMLALAGGNKGKEDV